MKLVVLGSGSSVPDGRRNMSGYWVEANDRRILLDCGPGVVPALPRYVDSWTDVSHVLVSHMHIDHVIELPALLFALAHAPIEREDPLLVIGPKGTSRMLEAMQDALQYGFLDPGFAVHVTDLAPGQAHQLDKGIELKVASAEHTHESLAMRLQIDGLCVGYTGDSGFSGALVDFFSGCDVLISDCSMAEGQHRAGHMSVDQVCTLARQAGVARLVATHLFPETDPDLVRRYLAQNFAGPSHVAHDGLTIEL
jgi:ribonuclease BN (tRNA processing enzyme)